MSEYNDFEEMEVWRDAQDLAEQVYRDFLSVKDYSFCGQIKRAAVSISNNVEENALNVFYDEWECIDLMSETLLLDHK